MRSAGSHALGSSLSQFAVALLLLVVFPGLAAAAQDPSFPRGPGFYFSIPKLILLVGPSLIWVSSCHWVHNDAADLNVQPPAWNLAMAGGGLAAVFMLGFVPWFLVWFPFLWGLYLTPTLLYVRVRNKLVRPDQRVLTKRHLKSLAERFLRLKFRKKAVLDIDSGVPVRFIGKSRNARDEDPARVARAEGSRGYKAAREMVYEAIQARATDIHLEPTKEEMQVRFRIDGILQTTAPFSRQMGDAVVNIFKVLGALDITEKRKPQDGSFSAEVEDRVVDFRIATAGSVAGEKLVMRILDKSQQIVSLTSLGMRDRFQEQIRQIVTQPHGMLIVCGPTGAGKSTTLYASLNEIDRFQRNVITVENPVEYQLDNVTQIEINPKAGKTFATELRSILRQDPDVIMIGEIRDQETAEIACQAAQTGHMVFSTLHANDTVTALGRLIDLGVAPFMVSSALSAILGQRLVRLLCPKCKVRYKPNSDMLRKANLPADKIKYFYRPPEASEISTDENGEPQPCDHCGGTGYHGRTGIFEFLIITDRIRDLIRDNPNLNAIRQEAIKSGMRYLQEDGLRQVIEGKTSIQELLRVSK